MNKIESTSLNLEKLNVEKLKELFPNVVIEGKIDFDKLKVILGDQVDDRVEKYQFTWNGKSNTIKLAQSPSTGTLIPSKDDSKNWNTTESLYIEGDNLEVLKQLQKTYYGKIKMIYIDPPYNTGGDFVYKDDFKDNIQNYKEQTKQTSRANPETNGRYHTDWLNMMYSRMLLAKNLLKDDGVIFISIDDNEVTSLRKVCDELFGEQNFICQFIWKSKLGKVGTTKTISATHEYILCYGKHSENVEFKMIESSNDGRRENLRQWGQADRREDRPSMFYPITINGISVLPIKEDGSEGRWRVSKDTANDLLLNGLLELVEKDGKFNIYRIFEPGLSITSYDTLLLDDIGTTAKGSITLKNLDLAKVFDFSKPIELIKHFITLSVHSNDIILDFFSGSATTAHAVMQLNAEDGGNRKFIMVQLPELTDASSEAYKAGYKNICEIGKERIRRAGEQIKQELIDKKNNAGLLDDNIVDPETFDNGFKVFKLESTNIIPWDGTIKFDEDTIFSQTEVIKEDRTSLDVLYEIMLKYGVFDKPVDEIKVNGKTMYSIAKGYLIVCLDNNISLEDVKEIGKLKPRNVIFKESGFRNDNDKINATYTLEKLGVEEVKSI
jgi:adenine-specific DNA-methyltransferase